jgi:hypothetical protein
VLGTVDLWGRIMEHEWGYRAELAYPQRLGLICPFCFWQLTPSCDAHFATAIDTGYPVTAEFGPVEVLGSLLASYLVDPMDADSLSRSMWCG